MDRKKSDQNTSQKHSSGELRNDYDFKKADWQPHCFWNVVNFNCSVNELCICWEIANVQISASIPGIDCCWFALFVVFVFPSVVLPSPPPSKGDM